MQGQPHDIRVLEELFEGEERGSDSESRSSEADAFPFHQAILQLKFLFLLSKWELFLCMLEFNSIKICFKRKVK